MYLAQISMILKQIEVGQDDLSKEGKFKSLEVRALKRLNKLLELKCLVVKNDAIICLHCIIFSTMNQSLVKIERKLVVQKNKSKLCFKMTKVV